MELAGGAPLTATTVSSGGVLVLESGAVANVTQVKGGGNGGHRARRQRLRHDRLERRRH